MIKTAANLAKMCATQTARHKFALQQPARMPPPPDMEVRDPGNNRGVTPRAEIPTPAPTAPKYLRNWTPEQLNKFQNTENWINSYIRRPTATDNTYNNWIPPMKAPEDFKVDIVGLSNDFRIVPPSSTLAVRG